MGPSFEGWQIKVAAEPLIGAGGIRYMARVVCDDRIIWLCSSAKGADAAFALAEAFRMVRAYEARLRQRAHLAPFRMPPSLPE